MKTIKAFLLFFALCGPLAAATLEEDVTRYVAIFNGDKSQHVKAGQSLESMGISDPRVFDVVEKNLLAEGKTTVDDRAEKARMAWYIRALGFSGQAKYEATLRSFVKDFNYDGYARTALVDIPKYKLWNPIISNRTTFDPKYSDDVNRVRNMLQSDDWLLKRVGAREVYSGVYQDVLFEMLAQDLKANYMTINSGYSDSIAWMAKALGKNPAYRPLLQEIADKAPDPKVNMHATQALQKMR